LHANMIKTGERTYCIIAEWSDMDALVSARTQMIATLDSFRDTLEDWGEASASPTRCQVRWCWRSNSLRTSIRLRDCATAVVVLLAIMIEIDHLRPRTCKVAPQARRMLMKLKGSS
jgi:hypothetical protein